MNSTDDQCPFKHLPPLPARETICEHEFRNECEKFGSLLEMPPFKAGPNGRDEPVMPSLDPFKKP